MQAGPNLSLFNLDVVQVSLEELEDRRREVDDMSKKVEEMKSDNDFALHRKDLDWEIEIKRVNEEKDNLVAAEQARFSDLQKLHDETG